MGSGAAADLLPAGECGDRPAERWRDRIAERHADRHQFRVRVSRRTAVAIRGDASRCQLHSRLPGTAAGADDQRTGIAAVLLGRAAADHRRIRLAAAPRDGHRRRLGARCRGACVRRHDRGAVAGASVSRAHAARRIVRADDLRHGGRRRHGDGDLRHVPRTADPERARQHPDRLGDQHAGRPGGGRADGAVRPGGSGGGTPGHRGPAAQCAGRAGEGHDRRRSRAGRHRRDVAGGGRVRRTGQRGARRAAALGRCRHHAAAHLRLAVPPGDVADRPAVGRSRRRRGADGHQDGAQRVRRLCWTSPRCRPIPSRRARG